MKGKGSEIFNLGLSLYFMTRSGELHINLKQNIQHYFHKKKTRTEI